MAGTDKTGNDERLLEKPKGGAILPIFLPTGYRLIDDCHKQW